MRKINVFFGSNNSGKSMTARLIHGALRTKPTPSTPDYVFGSDVAYFSRARFTRGRAILDAGDLYENYGYQLLRMVSGGITDLITQSRRQCKIGFSTKEGSMNLSLTRNGTVIWDNAAKRIIRAQLGSRAKKDHGQLENSVYVPAARTGIMQLFSNLMLMRNRLLTGLVRTVGAVRPPQREMSASEMRRFLRLFGSLPLYLEEFYDLILEYETRDVADRELLATFNSLLRGQIEIRKEQGLPTIYFVDQTGAPVDIEWSGSGVISLLAILVGLYHVAPRGTLIIEEPEAHFEPSVQLALIRDLCTAAKRKDISLVVATHSDYIVKRVLSLVGNRLFQPQEVGLYYFDRPEKELTRIHSIEIDKTGEAEAPLFRDAIETLVKERTHSMAS
jgi:hypothetical protein